MIHFHQQFRLALPIWRISRYWIWPTITSKSFQFQFRQCQNFVFWTYQSIDSVHCLADLAPFQCSKYSICHTIIWTKTHCPEISSWWVIDDEFLFKLFHWFNLVMHFGFAETLRALYLGDNEFEHIPPGLGNLKNLQIVNKKKKNN